MSAPRPTGIVTSEIVPSDVAPAASSSSSGVPLYKRHYFWWLLALLVICVPAVIIGADYKKTWDDLLPETLPFPSTYNKKGSGYSALMELLQRSGVGVNRWESPYRNLNLKKVKGTLVIISPWETFGDGDVNAITQWISEGNDLVLIDYFTLRTGRKFLSRLGMTSRDVKNAPESDVAVTVSQDLPEAQFAQTIYISAEARVHGGTTVAGDKHGDILANTNVGKGRVLVGTMPSFCSNISIVDPTYRKNFQFMYNWLSNSKQPIFFDEKCHGFSSGSNVFLFVFRSPVGFVILQMFLVALIAFLSLNQRFGSPLMVASLRKISNLEFIDGLASAIRRAKARDTAWFMLFHPLKARMCKMYGVAPHEPLEKLASAWSEHTGKDKQECEQFLLAAQAALDSGNIDDAKLTKLVETADKLTDGTRELVGINKTLGA